MTEWKPGPKSAALFEQAQQVIPGGVNSPVRAFLSVGMKPFLVERADGPNVTDVDGIKYTDFMGSWGPMILGHNSPIIRQALISAAERGASFGASHPQEIELANQICDRFASIDMVRLVSSGTEATMSAIRLARGATGRDKIIKFVGCYHGHADAFLIKAGSGAATLGVPSSPGVPAGSAKDTLTARYNDLEDVAGLLAANKNQVAAIIVEPVAGNMGCVLPKPGFLAGLRKLCDQHGTLLIFDEVITGFRIARGGAQERFSVTPDLTCLGKILGGGMPVGAFGGKKEIMNQISPLGPVYQAGTLSGNPLAVACGVATLKALDNPEVYDQLEKTGQLMEQIIKESANKAGAVITLNRVGSMMSFFFAEGPVENWDQVAGANIDKFNRLFAVLLNNRISIAPSAFEVLFVGTTHTDAVLEQTRAGFEQAFEAAGAV